MYVFRFTYQYILELYACLISLVASKSCVLSNGTIRSNTGEEDSEKVIVVKVRFKCDFCGIKISPSEKIPI